RYVLRVAGRPPEPPLSVKPHSVPPADTEPRGGRVRTAKKPEDILWALLIQDVQAAADVFRPVYDKTRGKDGFVSIEVGPTIANSTQRTIKFAEYLHYRCRRPNVMIKIRATKEGLPPIQDQISQAPNINTTLIS